MFMVMAVMASCGNDNDLPTPSIPDKGTVTDNEGNQYEWVQIGDLRWTTSNAKNGLFMGDKQIFNGFNFDYVFEEDEIEKLIERYLPKYGNLMNWEDALESVPDGWRIPTDEDWQKLEQCLGMKNTNSLGIRGGHGVGLSLQNPDNGIALICGGGMNKRWHDTVWFSFEVDHVAEFGYYWSSTEAEVEREDYRAAYGRKIFSDYPGVERQKYDIEKCFSVRWVQDVK